MCMAGIRLQFTKLLAISLTRKHTIKNSFTASKRSLFMKQKYNFHCRKVYLLHHFGFMVRLLQITLSPWSKELLVDGVITAAG